MCCSTCPDRVTSTLWAVVPPVGPAPSASRLPLFPPERWCVINFNRQLCKKCWISAPNCSFYSCWPSRVACCPSVSHFVPPCRRETVFLSAVGRSFQTVLNILTWQCDGHLNAPPCQRSAVVALLLTFKVCFCTVQYLTVKLWSSRFDSFISKWMNEWKSAFMSASRCRQLFKMNWSSSEFSTVISLSGCYCSS